MYAGKRMMLIIAVMVLMIAAVPMKGFGIDSHNQYNEDESYRYMSFRGDNRSDR